MDFYSNIKRTKLCFHSFITLEYREQTKDKLHKAELFLWLTDLMQIEGETFMRKKMQSLRVIKSKSHVPTAACSAPFIIPFYDIFCKAVTC